MHPAFRVWQTWKKATDSIAAQLLETYHRKTTAHDVYSTLASCGGSARLTLQALSICSRQVATGIRCASMRLCEPCRKTQWTRISYRGITPQSSFSRCLNCGISASATSKSSAVWTSHCLFSGDMTSHRAQFFWTAKHLPTAATKTKILQVLQVLQVLKVLKEPGKWSASN